MERFNRAVRRFHLERMKQKARRIYPWSPRAHHWANNLALCSGPCCGNPRHWGGGPTRAEQLVEFEERERMPTVRGSKRRARWCRGRVGVEHQLQWQPSRKWCNLRPSWKTDDAVVKRSTIWELVCVICGRLFVDQAFTGDEIGLQQKHSRWSLRGKVRQLPPLPTE